MSGLFGARSPSASFNLLAGKRKSGAPVNPGQGQAFVPPSGTATPTGQPTVTPRRKAKAIKDGEKSKLRTSYG